VPLPSLLQLVALVQRKQRLKPPKRQRAVTLAQLKLLWQPQQGQRVKLLND
jgi:hypothetical protein